MKQIIKTKEHFEKPITLLTGDTCVLTHTVHQGDKLLREHTEDYVAESKCILTGRTDYFDDGSLEFKAVITPVK